MSYFRISTTEDGVYVEEIPEDHIQKFLLDVAEGDYGPVDFAKKFPNERGPDYWPINTSVLIKGEIVVPRKVEVVTRLEVD